MRFGACIREPEVSAALRAGHWPGACDAALQAHVSECTTCADLVLVSTTFATARAETLPTAPQQSPGALWWRAQLLRRKEALERLDQPTMLVGRFALLSTVVMAIGLLGLQWQECRQWLRWLSELTHSPALRMEGLWVSTPGWSLMLVACLASVAVVGGFALLLHSDRG